MQTNFTPQPQKKQVQKRRVQQQPRRQKVVENTDILAESEEMIATLQEKIQGVFYRFGMAGLERLDEAIVNTCQQMMYPDGVPTKAARQQAAPSYSKPVRQQPQQKNQPKSYIDSVTELASAALGKFKDRPAQKPQQAPETDEQPTMPSSNKHAFNPLTDLPPSAQVDTSADYMEQLSEEDRAILQQGMEKDRHDETF